MILLILSALFGFLGINRLLEKYLFALQMIRFFTEKGAFEDIRNGKRTCPLIFAECL